MRGVSKRREHDRNDRTAEERALHADLEALYRDVDARYAAWSCPSSTDCCRFAVTGREPYITSIEESLLRRAIAARGGVRAVVAKTRPSLPMAIAERRCPLLDEGGRCTVYAARPLGCRTFYCDRATEGDRVRQDDINELVRRVQAIAARHRSGGDRGRPLTRALADVSSRQD